MKTIEEMYELRNLFARQIKALTLSKAETWSDEEILYAQLENSDIKPIIELNESSSTRPKWQNISHFSANTKCY